MPIDDYVAEKLEAIKNMVVGGSTCDSPNGGIGPFSQTVTQSSSFLVLWVSIEQSVMYG